ncbi:MAG: 30S ribosomal protein S11 [Euryarchaeota archaeon]|jgi:small subunit ribosomal protein S11|nr:30S ribosomal protein S11 [Euryarchaeota archaeon]|tara:strand:+ start:25861 stop:26253 length:393 start_codon:yes stop_codon:yes gene_type:complete
MAKEGKKAIIRIYSSFNNTHITATDVTGAETISSMSGGMVVRLGKDKSKQYAAVQMASQISEEIVAKGFTSADVHVRAPGGNKSRSQGPGAKTAIRTLTRSSLKINKIEDSTPVQHGHLRKKGGKRGRRV